MIPLPDRQYSIIYADPPWTYNDKALAGQRGAGCKYPLMTLEDIKRLDVPSISAPDCALFCWVTMPLLSEGLETIKAWGFEYKTCAFTWVKKNKKTDTPFFGMGNWTRSNAELCLLGVKGKIKRQSAAVSQIIWGDCQEVLYEPIGEHSEKPAIVREKIMQLMGDLPRIELFARQRVEGWDAWGNEV